ncbi:MAG TPA: hypothetical protein VI391_00220, partial [Thermoanaerobaculia bacterium]
AIGIAFWPLIFLWTSQCGFRWSPLSARLVFVALAILAIRNFRLPRTSARFALTWTALFAAAIVSRVLQARELVFPAWADSVHHAMIVRLLMEHGRIPPTYDPFIPHGQFYYHWGYHALVAFVCWLTGLTSAARLPAVMLAFGQLLNALTFVTVYAAGRVLFRNRYAGLAAATLATTLSMFPAFYLSWGRYTHLTGVLLLPPFLIALWRGRDVPLMALLAAGLFLIHVRIAFFAALIAIVMLAFRRRFVLRWAAAAGIAIILAAPWLGHLLTNRHVAQFVRPAVLQADDIHMTMPIEDLFVQNSREMISFATFGISGMAGLFDMPPLERIASGVWWLLAILIWARSEKSRVPWRAMLFIAAVVIFVGVVLQLRAGGVVFTRLASNASAVITAFLPITLAAGGLIAWIVPRRALPLLLVAAAIYGVLTMRHIVSPVTVLADADDAAAMDWIRTSTPPTACFAVNAMPWMEEAFIGMDGGYWIPIVTGRSTILPPALYAWSVPAAEVSRINRAITMWNGFVLPDAPVTFAYTNRLRDNGRWQTIARIPSARLVYARGNVSIFAIPSRIAASSKPPNRSSRPSPLS